MLEYDNKKFISVREAAKECGRNMETVRRWIWSGKLPAEKLGNQLFIKREDLASYCRETAIKYDAGDAADVTARLEHLRERIRAGTRGGLTDGIDIGIDASEGDINMKMGSRANLIKKMRRLREEIYARTGKVFDAETMIRELREERERETR